MTKSRRKISLALGSQGCEFEPHPSDQLAVVTPTAYSPSLSTVCLAIKWGSEYLPTPTPGIRIKQDGIYHLAVCPLPSIPQCQLFSWLAGVHQHTSPLPRPPPRFLGGESSVAHAHWAGTEISIPRYQVSPQAQTPGVRATF